MNEHPDATPSNDTRSCPQCGKPIRTKALQCRHCRTWFHEPASGESEAVEPRGGGMTAGGATAIPRAPSFESSDYSNAQSPRHLVLLSVLTFGLYEFYWFYRNWRDLREHAGADVSPGWRTVGLLVPFVNIFMVHHQLSLVREVAESDGDTVYYAPGALTLAFFGLAILSNLTMLWALSLLTVVPLLPVQATLNRYWARRQPGLRVREDFESYELLLMMAGAMMTLAVVASSLGS